MGGRWSPAEGWPTVALLAALVYITMRTIETAGWAERIWLAPPLGLLGVSVGLVVAKSRLRSVWALPLGFGIGLEAVLLSQALITPGTTWAEKLGGVSEALREWLRAALTQGASHDPLVLAALLGGVGYLIGLCSSWLVFRLQNGWWPLIFNATVGLVHLSYATVDSIPPFLLSLLSGLLMVASLELHLRQGVWRAVGVPTQATSTAWTLGTAAGLAGLGLLVALRLPAGDINAALAMRYQALMEPWRGFQRQVDRLVGGGKGESRPDASNLAFPESLTPREDFDPGSQPVLKIVSPRRDYWRTSTYDGYDGRSMAVSGAAERRYEPNQSLPVDPENGHYRSAVQQTVTVVSPGAAALFAADAPTTFSVPLMAEQREVGWDLAATRPATALQRGHSYSVTSSVLVAGRRQLGEASTTYPPWVERYLELPGSVPARVGALANELTADAANPFERALAIEAYLRALTYSTHTTVPPSDRDWVDFLLFESRNGYCDYFATAMTVMLRSQRIPARVASGFAPGLYDQQERAWLVRESEAHSWTEAYFPGYGWVTFEPSAIRPTPDRPESARVDGSPPGGGVTPGEPAVQDDADAFAPGPRDGFAGTLGRPSTVGLAVGVLGALALIAGIGLALFALAWDRGLSEESPERRRYAHLLRWLRWGGWNLKDSATPYEMASDVGASFPALKQPLDRLVQHHVEATYGSTSAGTSNDAEAAWQSLRRPLATAMLRRRLGRKATSPQRRGTSASRP
jgi:transglutaminase-like putative cysteine protease